MAMKLNGLRNTLNGARFFTVVIFLLMSAMAFSCAGRKGEITEQDKAASTNYYKLAVNYYSQGNVIEALKALQEADEFNPYNKEVKNLYGLIFLGKKDLEKAEEYLEEAVDIDPKFSDAYNNLGAVLMDKEEWEKAIDNLKVATLDILYPYKDKAYDNMGWCYHKLGNDTKAIEYLRTAVMENHKSCHAWYNLGRVFKEAAQFEDSVEALENSVKYCDAFLDGHYELGITSFRIKDFDRAKKALTRCSELDGDGVKGSECKNYLNYFK